MKSLSHVRLFTTPWTVAYQAPPSLGLSRQEYSSGLPFPSPVDLPYPRIELTSSVSPELADGFFPTALLEKPQYRLLVQFSSVAQSCPTLCDPMNCSTPGLPVHHQLPEFTQTDVHRVGDAIQPSYPLCPLLLLPPIPPSMRL